MRVSCFLFVAAASHAAAFAPAPSASLAPHRRRVVGLSMSATTPPPDSEKFSILGSTRDDEGPRAIKGRRGAFLGVRRESGALRRGLERVGGGVGLGSSMSDDGGVTPLMPLGGLSPCVIKVLGCGGGGSNAVSSFRAVKISYRGGERRASTTGCGRNKKASNTVRGTRIDSKLRNDSPESVSRLRILNKYWEPVWK